MKIKFLSKHIKDRKKVRLSESIYRLKIEILDAYICFYLQVYIKVRLSENVI